MICHTNILDETGIETMKQLGTIFIIRENILALLVLCSQLGPFCHWRKSFYSIIPI